MYMWDNIACLQKHSVRKVDLERSAVGSPVPPHACHVARASSVSEWGRVGGREAEGSRREEEGGGVDRLRG